jgi:hypothetical protein
MKSLLRKTTLLAACLFLIFSALNAQKTETKNGILLVHNGKTGKWDNSPKVSLAFVKTIGSLESDDENVLFYMPSDIAFDTQGHVYVLDFGNHRIQKFDSEGRYISTIGRKGQGPGEFQYPQSIDLDADGYLYVSDPGNRKIQVLKPDGSLFKTISLPDNPPGVIKIAESGQIIMGGGEMFFQFGIGESEKEAELPKIIHLLDQEGKAIKSFVEQKDYKSPLVNRLGNRFHFTLDKEGNTYVAFDYQNRIEKYSPEVKLVWRSDRKLNYDISEPKEKGSISGSGGLRAIRMPDMNRCSNGIAVDEQGRIWVAALKRQIEEEESVGTNVRATMSAGGQRSMNLSVVGNTDVRETDAFHLEVYDAKGFLLGKIPVDHFVDNIFIAKDRIYLLDRMRGMQFYEYKIINK